MKKALLLFIGLMLIGTTVLASPLMNYDQGKGSIDLTWRNVENSGTAMWDDGHGLNGGGEKKYNLDGALTLGLGNKFAFQYRTFAPESKETPIDNSSITSKTKYTTNEFNIMYKVDNNFAVFTGLVNAKGEVNISDSFSGYNFTTKSKNLWQLGVVGSTPIGEKTTLWASVAAGSSSLLNWEIGVGYEFAPNFEFNLNYREFKVNDLTGTASNGYGVKVDDAKAKGLGFGITYKF